MDRRTRCVNTVLLTGMKILQWGLIGIVLGGSCVSALAANSPQVVVQSRSGLSAGALGDGQLIAQGRVTYSEPHQGFRVWSEGSQVQGQAHRYQLMSAGGHSLNIRLAGKGWQSDTQTGNGIVNRTGELSQSFDVEVDGAQTLPVDTWVLIFQAVVLQP
ncbi:TPA: AfaD family invasin [Providencia alcalifaciens]